MGLSLGAVCRHAAKAGTVAPLRGTSRMLRPVPTVRVTTKEELDAALATADRITVEGDDTLLSYAVSKGSQGP